MIKSKIISNLTIFAVVLVMTVPIIGSAAIKPGTSEFQGGGSGTGIADASNPLVSCESVETCDWDAFTQLLNKVKDYALQLAVLVSVIFIVYAGGLYLTAAGDSGKIKTAHTILQNVVIGFFLASAGWLIISAITKTLEVNDEFLPRGFDQ